MIRHVAIDGSTGLEAVNDEWGELHLIVLTPDPDHPNDPDYATREDVTAPDLAVPERKVLMHQLELIEPYAFGPGLFEYPWIKSTVDVETAYPWLVSGKPVAVYAYDPGYEPATPGEDPTKEHLIWAGVSNKPRTTSTGTTWSCDGHFTGHADHRVHHPEILSELRDIGQAIARCLDPESYSRFLAPFPFTFTAATTGITTRRRGSRGQGRLGYVDDLLTLAQDDDGQWTISCTYDVHDEAQLWSYYMRRKGPIYTSTLWLGTAGVFDNLVEDAGPAVNVIYGEGTDPDTGEAWQKKKAPNLRPRTPPAYPTRSTGSGPIALGDTDGDFSSPSYAISRMQAQLLSDGFGGDVTGEVDAETITALNRMEEFYGLPFENTVDSDLWDQLWSTDGTSNPFLSIYFAPLAADTRVEPYLFFTDGSYRGPNPDFDPTIRRVEATIQYGDCSLVDAEADARRQIEREADGGGLVGDITLKDGISPIECHAYMMRAGGEVVIPNWHGSTELHLHTARIVIQPLAKQVTLTVSERQYDVLALSAILDRVAEAKVDPGKSLWVTNREDKKWSSAVGWDGELGLGDIPVTALTGGQWNKIRFLGPQVGNLKEIQAWALDPAVRYALAWFGKDLSDDEVTELAAAIPYPLDDPGDGEPNFWEDPANEAMLNRLRHIETWGRYTDSAGFWPRKESNDPTPAETGRLKDRGGLAIASADRMFYTALIWPEYDSDAFRQAAKVGFAEST